MQAAIGLGAQASDFKISLTWCIRLPHDTFPLQIQDKSKETAPFTTDPEDKPAPEERRLGFEQMPVEDLTLGDIERIFGSQVFDDISVDVLVRLLER